jgi:hypothetical protein
MPFLDRSPLEYQVNTAVSIRRWEDTRPPTNADFKQFKLGDHWLDTTARLWWILAFRDSTQGLWRMLGTVPGGLTNLTPDAGGMVTPDMANNINVLGSTGIVTTGNPGLNTITFSTSGGAPIPQYLQGNAGGPITPDGASIIYVVGTATNGINIVGNGGTFTLTASLSGLYTDGDFIFRNDAVATPRVVTISNTNANALSSANLTIAVPPASFDPFTLYQINATQTYSVGIDNSDSDTFKITDGINPSIGNVLFQITTAGVPSFPTTGALPVASGGTGATSITANAFIVGDGANPVNEIGPLLDGELIIGSTGAAPVAATLTAGAGITIVEGPGSITISSTSIAAFEVNIQTFTVTGNYVPTVGMIYCIIECLGGGGGGGGCALTPAGQYSTSIGGSSAEYARGHFTAAAIGALQVVTIGAGGIGVDGNNGTNGGNTSVGALISAFGGIGGSAGGAFAVGGWYGIQGILGGTGGAGGDIRCRGQGASSVSGNSSLVSGSGGNTQYGAGGINININANGNNATGYGAGGGGSCNAASQPARKGGSGSSGIVIVTEYIII